MVFLTPAIFVPSLRRFEFQKDAVQKYSFSPFLLGVKEPKNQVKLYDLTSSFSPLLIEVKEQSK
jgi:hypothetical protein